jgi:hypothetical protein
MGSNLTKIGSALTIPKKRNNDLNIGFPFHSVVSIPSCASMNSRIEATDGDSLTQSTRRRGSEPDGLRI